MKHLTIILAFLMTLSAPVSAEDENLFKGKSYGSFMFFEEVPNALFFEDDISKNDSFEFRKAIRNHDIDTIVLSSPGGALFEGLTIAGMIFDKKLTTYVPKTGRCASACAFMFFAGNNRQATGRLGVHQFYSNSDDESAKIANVEYGSQFTVSEIIGYLNEFETPPFVFEKMFAQKQMYFFSDGELAKLNTAPTDESTLANFSKIDEFVIKAKEATKQDKAEEIEAKATEEVKDDNDLVLRKQIQAELNRIGCTLGRVDGKIGPASKRALSRFNKLNKSSYNVKAFFDDETQLEQLKKINSGFCPDIVQAEIDSAIAQAKIDSANTTLWRGEQKCVSLFNGITRFNGFTNFAKVQKMSESSLNIDFSDKFGNSKRSLKTSKKANGKYFGTSPGLGLKPDRFNFDIDFVNGTLYAKQELSGIICGGLRAVFLVLPLCHWNMQLANEDEVPIISKLFEQ